jgi:hypothetical protein
MLSNIDIAHKVLSVLGFEPEELIKTTCVTWFDFINEVMKDNPNITKYLGFTSAPRVTELFKYSYPEVFTLKKGRPWKSFLLNIIEYKQCNVCSNILPLGSYPKDSGKISGVKSSCKLCVKISRHSYYINNKAVHRFNDSMYRARKVQALPLWADLKAMSIIYSECPEGYHVDHIIPLQNEYVCGLHCEFNLQHLTASENLIKGNKFEV